jgi:small subunit ribosomal protein S23
MKPQVGAVNVLERTSHYLKRGVLSKQPAWFNVVGQHPPNKSFLREPKQLKIQQSFDVAQDSLKGQNVNRALYKTRESQKPGRNVYKPQKLSFVEDELRALFYEQHPWELSRPKILLENNGDEASRADWSSIRQLNQPLDGESVVQRTLYLLNKENGYTLESAYDQARFEFYRVRMEQEIQQQVSGEENQMYGAVYGESALQHGVEKEQEFIDTWKQKAVELTEMQQSSRVSPQDEWQQAETVEGGLKSPETTN